MPSPFLPSIVVLAILLPGPVLAQPNEPAQESPEVIPLDTLRVGEAESDTTTHVSDTYEELIPFDAVSHPGLFTVHEVDDTYFFEIPLQMLEREVLLQTRVTRTATGMGFGGQQESSAVVRLERRDDRVFLRLVGHDNVAADTLPIFEAVRNSNFEPILYSFEVKAMPPDSTAVVIDVTPFFRSDTPIIGLHSNRREQYQIRSLSADRSFIESIRSFPENIEVRRTVTYSAGRPPAQSVGETISMQLGHSLVLLPDEPMTPRPWDERVGYFSIRQNDFGVDAQRLVERRYVQRWRLEPSDPDAYARGELVEPVRAITLYIDPATPEQWRPYLRQGVEDWSVAFEAAGFRNAIEARMPPTPQEDPTFDPADARHSMIRYLASPVQNASGPRFYDPRSGEVLGAHIQWHHNVVNLVRNWYFVQTAAANPEARNPELTEEVMGALIRYVAAHEVGHVLGLSHNMKGHSGIPVDSLRTRWVCEHGTSASIMDYARFNYVAQPGDDTCFIPRVGPYDRWAIEWGYRVIPDADFDKQRSELNRWIVDRGDSPLFHFGDPSGLDPGATTEALGDDAVRASDFGVENLKRIVPRLRVWTHAVGAGYERLRDRYEQVIAQWSRYVGHVVTLIGGVEWTRRVHGQDGIPYQPVSAVRQQAALDYLDRQVLQTPLWLVESDVLSRIEPTGTQDRIRDLQVTALNQVLSVNRMKRLIEQEMLLGTETYTLQGMLTDLSESVWRELVDREPIDAYRRNLQRGYLDRMEFLLEQSDARTTDISPLAQGQLRTILARAENARGGSSHEVTELHLEDVISRVRRILDPER